MMMMMPMILMMMFVAWIVSGNEAKLRCLVRGMPSLVMVVVVAAAVAF